MNAAIRHSISSAGGQEPDVLPADGEKSPVRVKKLAQIEGNASKHEASAGIRE